MTAGRFWTRAIRQRDEILDLVDYIDPPVWKGRAYSTGVPGAPMQHLCSGPRSVMLSPCDGRLSLCHRHRPVGRIRAVSRSHIAVTAAAAESAALASRVLSFAAAPPPVRLRPGRRALKPGPRLHQFRCTAVGVGMGVRVNSEGGALEMGGRKRFVAHEINRDMPRLMCSSNGDPDLDVHHLGWSQRRVCSWASSKRRATAGMPPR